MQFCKKSLLAGGVAVVMLAACGGSGSSSSNATPSVVPTPTPTPAPSPNPAPSPSPQAGLEQSFPVFTSVFGVQIRATASTASEKVLHAANVMAQYLDNNEDGLPDNPLVVDKLVEAGATLIMAPTESALESAASGVAPSDAYQALYGDETFPTVQPGRFDATLEEVLHLITHVGYSKVYPDVFGEKADSSIADAMDIARGGRFETIPQTYPEGAWYTYDDATCDYSCMVTEYTYWALTSILGAQQSRLEQIQHEWRLNTEEKVRMQDPAIHAILTNPEYALATRLPNGVYSAEEITLNGHSVQPGVGQANDILQAVKAANPGYKIAFTDETNVFMMSPDGTNVTLLADGSPIAGYVSWGPNGEYVYFASARGEAQSAWEGFRVSVKDKSLAKLTQFGQDVRSLGVSPDGNYLAISVMSGNSNIGDNNDNLSQFHTNLYIVDMAKAQAIWDGGQYLTLSDMQTLVASPAEEQFWYEELHWRPTLPGDGGEPVLAYSKTWRYDEDDVSYSHAYTIRADGSEQTLIAENKDQPIWDFQGQRLAFLDLSFYDFASQSLGQLVVTGIEQEVAVPATSPDGSFVLFEVGDENRRLGMARLSSDSDNPGVIIGDVNGYEPRWSPVPVETKNTDGEIVIGAKDVSSCQQAGQRDEVACFIVTGEQAEMNGVIGNGIVSKVNLLISQYPQVQNIVLSDVPGSMDDEANLQAAKALYDAGLNTEVNGMSKIASGGVDFFLAGYRRVVAPGAEIGVHSWAFEDEQGRVIQGRDVPRDDPQHSLYIDFYRHIQHPNPSEFYFFTLDAATAEGIHIMTEEEIINWQMAR